MTESERVWESIKEYIIRRCYYHSYETLDKLTLRELWDLYCSVRNMKGGENNG